MSCGDSELARGLRYADLVLDTAVDPDEKTLIVRLERVEPEFFRRCEDERGLDAATNHLYAQFKANPSHVTVNSLDQLPEAFEVMEVTAR